MGRKTITIKPHVHDALVDLSARLQMSQADIVDLAIRQVYSGNVSIAPMMTREPQANYGSNVNNGGKVKKQTVKKHS